MWEVGKRKSIMRILVRCSHFFCPNFQWIFFLHVEKKIISWKTSKNNIIFHQITPCFFNLSKKVITFSISNLFLWGYLITSYKAKGYKWLDDPFGHYFVVKYVCIYICMYNNNDAGNVLLLVFWSRARPFAFFSNNVWVCSFSSFSALLVLELAFPYFFPFFFFFSFFKVLARNNRSVLQKLVGRGRVQQPIHYFLSLKLKVNIDYYII